MLTRVIVERPRRGGVDRRVRAVPRDDLPHRRACADPISLPAVRGNSMKISARCADIWSVRSAVRGDGKEPWYRPLYVVVKDGNRLPEEKAWWRAGRNPPPRLLDRVALAADREQGLVGLPACGAPARDRANRGGR